MWKKRNMKNCDVGATASNMPRNIKIGSMYVDNCFHNLKIRTAACFRWMEEMVLLDDKELVSSKGVKERKN